MKDEYDFSKAKTIQNSLTGKKSISIQLDVKALLWLEESAEKLGIEYQTFLNNFLLEQWDKSQAKNQTIIE